MLSQNAGESDHFVLTERSGNDAPACMGYFAFRLTRITQARSGEEETRAVAAALHWHCRLLGVLAGYGSEVEFHLRYVARPDQPGRLQLALIASVAGREVLPTRRRALRMEADLRTYLKKTVRSGAGVYYFEPVVSESELQSLLVPVFPRTALRLSRPALTAELPPAVLALNGFDARTDLPVELTHLARKLPKFQKLRKSGG